MKRIMKQASAFTLALALILSAGQAGTAVVLAGTSGTDQGLASELLNDETLTEMEGENGSVLTETEEPYITPTPSPTPKPSEEPEANLEPSVESTIEPTTPLPVQYEVSFIIDDTPIYLSEGESVSEQTLLKGVSAVDEQGKNIPVRVASLGGLNLSNPMPAAYVITFEAAHPVTKVSYTDTKSCYVEPAVQVETTAEPTEPSVEPTVETTDPTEPSVEPTVETTDPTEPSVEPTAETTEQTEPSVETTAETTEPTEPSVEPTAETTEPTEPSVEPTVETTEPTAETTDPTEPSVEPTAETTDPTEPATDGSIPSTEQIQHNVIFEISDTPLYLNEGEPVVPEDLLEGVYAVDELGNEITVSISDLGGLNLVNPVPTGDPWDALPYTITFESIHPVSEIPYTETRDCYVIDVKEDAGIQWGLVDGTLFITGNGVLPDLTADGIKPWSGAEFTRIHIGEGVTSIGSYTFYGCSSLESVTFGAGSALAEIGESAFMGCNKLTEITFPSSLSSIGNSAFSGCTSLAKIWFDGTIPPVVGTDAFANISPEVIWSGNGEAYENWDGMSQLPSAMAISLFAAGHDLNVDTNTSSYEWLGDDLIITGSGTFTISGSTDTENIIVRSGDNVNLILDSARFNLTRGLALEIRGGLNVDLIIKGSVYLNSSDFLTGGSIYIDDNSTLNISGDGSSRLYVNSNGSSYFVYGSEYAAMFMIHGTVNINADSDGGKGVSLYAYSPAPDIPAIIVNQGGDFNINASSSSDYVLYLNNIPLAVTAFPANSTDVTGYKYVEISRRVNRQLVISPDQLDFGEITLPYNEHRMWFDMHNTGARDIDSVRVQIKSGEFRLQNAYNKLVSELEINEIEIGGQVQTRLVPVPGLKPGTYTGVLEITASGLDSISKTYSFTIPEKYIDRSNQDGYIEEGKAGTVTFTLKTFGIADGTPITLDAGSDPGITLETDKTTGSSTTVVIKTTADVPAGPYYFTLIIDGIKVELSVDVGPLSTDLELGDFQYDRAYVDYPYSSFIERLYAGSGTLTYTATGLPDGITIDPHDNVLSGTAKKTGKYEVVITVTDGYLTDTVTNTLTVVTPVLDIVRLRDDDIRERENYYKKVAYEYSGSRYLSFKAYNLPDGMDMDPDSGIISGRTSDTGDHRVTVVVTDGVLEDRDTYVLDVNRRSSSSNNNSSRNNNNNNSNRNNNRNSLPGTVIYNTPGYTRPVENVPDIEPSNLPQNAGPVQKLPGSTPAGRVFAKLKDQYNPAYQPPFTDVTSADWFFDDVAFVSQLGLMSGSGNGSFDPNIPLTRGMIATVLWNMAGQPPGASGSAIFSDIPTGDYYNMPVGWATNSGIASGMGDGTYNPGANLSRQDLAVLICRFADYADITLPQSRSYVSFADAAEISDYAEEAVRFLYSSGIINGKGNNMFEPKSGATRAEVAAMLMELVKKGSVQ